MDDDHVANNGTSEEAECRVCRMGPEDGRMLVSPCLCSGSIALVHQDCLEAWLTHSRKDKCELCGIKYQFSPQYAENTPKHLPISLLVVTILKKVVKDYIPRLFHVVAVLFVWLGFVPFFTCQLYRIWMKLDTFTFVSMRERLVRDTIGGAVLAAFIVLTFILMMSFFDFMRFHGLHEVRNPRAPAQGAGAGAAVQGVPAAVAPVVPPPHGQVQIDANNNNNNNNNQGVQERNDLDHARNIFPDFQGDDMMNFVENMDEYNNGNNDINQLLGQVPGAPVEPFPIDALAAIPNNNNNNLNNNNGALPPNLDLLAVGEGGEEVNRVDAANAAVLPDIELEEIDAELDEEELVDAIENDAPAAEGELRFAVDELLGLRRLDHLLRNAWLLLAFNCVYIGSFGSLPFTVGQEVLRLRNHKFFIVIGEYVYAAVPYIWDFFVQIATKSAATKNAVEFLDAVAVLMGYASIFVMLFSMNECLRKFRELAHPHFLNIIISSVSSIASTMKVGLLLFVRVFLLPICLGMTILWCFNILHNYSMDTWSTFVAENVMGGGSLAWVVGISYMVSTTLSVLQLREILHPSILGKSIRPQEPHVDLLISLMNEAPFVHIRRILSSLAVYMSLIFLFIFIPFWLSRWALLAVTGAGSAGAGSAAVFQYHFSYYIPQIQIPFELVFAHLGFLTLLDKRKNVIGRLEHMWLVFLSTKLGISRFILPHLMKRVPQVPGQPIADAFLKDEQGNPLVGAPLRRPPPGWDSRVNRNTTRWAWGNETLCVLEQHVAPRLPPKDWFIKTATLLFLTWLLLASLVVFTTFVPVLLGRSVFYLLQVPQRYIHDPHCFLTGITLVWFVVTTLLKTDFKKVFPILFRVPPSLLRLGIQSVLQCLFINLIFGVIVQTELFLLFPHNAAPFAWMSPENVVSIFAKGSIVMTAFVLVVCFGWLERFLQHFSYRTPDQLTDEEGRVTTQLVSQTDPRILRTIQWTQSLQQSLLSLYLHVPQATWESAEQSLRSLHSLWLNPLLEALHKTAWILLLFVAALHFAHQLTFPYFAIGLNLALVQLCFDMMYTVVSVAWNKLTATVIDDNFLVGRQLIDIRQQQQQQQQQNGNQERPVIGVVEGIH